MSTYALAFRTLARHCCGMDENVPSERADVVTLPRKTVQNDGAIRYHAVLARADVPMRYAWGIEVATEGALSDPEYLEGLRGISVVTMDTATHENGRPISVRADARAVGTVIDARWSEADRAVLIELVVHDDATLRDIEAGKTLALSEAYRPTTAQRSDGVIEQTSRRTNHVALVERGRMPGAGIRADQTEGALTMDEETMRALLGGLREVIAEELSGLREMMERADLGNESDRADENGEDEMNADAAQVAAVRTALGIDGELNADSISAGIDAIVKDRAARAEAVKLGADATRADAADFNAADFIAGVNARPKTAAARHSENVTTDTVGASRRLL